jgi:molybdate transport system substrate-binding protein
MRLKERSTVTMTMRTMAAAFAAAVIASTSSAAPAQTQAGELHVLASGAVTDAVTRLAADFTRETGEHVTLTFAQAGKVKRALDAGTPADVVVLSAPLMAKTERTHGVLPGSAVPLGRTGVTLAVRRGAPLPDISTPEALRRTLLAARKITYGDPHFASSGAYVAKMINRLGLTDALAPKTVFVTTGFGADLVAHGRADLVMQNLSEIVPVKGVTVVGPLPPSLETYFTYVAAVPTHAASAAQARAFIAYVTRPAALAAWHRAGFQPAAR